MIAIDNTIVSEHLLEKKFVCDINACKGECCVAGDSGAPLEAEEISIMEDILDIVKPYIPKDGVKAIEKQGVFVIDDDGDYTTPLVKGKHCAFTYFEDDIAKCSIEKAYYDGKVKFKKPISCHLYPVRITKYKDYDAVNYHKWEVCKPACECGTKLDVPVYKFLREPLIRKYGEAWYKQLEMADKLKKV
ncbi:MAG: hypothetical protein A3F72_21060 [Bacteroidetes bacterium RIFCSPLOWO2_12_FULL_35_15]|nr:MAG: hypothetical protein A3F72_21060 [Bacteroidetes bacterium RIFCSPLOWO2_12_FULL_35_15]